MPKIHQLHLKMNRPKQANKEMEGKTDLQVEGEDPKMWIIVDQDSQGALRGGTETGPLKEEVLPCITTGCLPKAAEPVEDAGESFMAVVVVIVVPTQQVQDLLVSVGVEWEAEVEETTAHQLVLAMSRNAKLREAVADMVRIGLSTTLPEPEIAVKLAARVRSMKKFQKGEGKGDQKLAVRVPRVTLVNRTKRKSKNQTQKMALIMPTL